MSAASWALLVAVYVACCVETVEATTVVMAMGFTRSWKSSWIGTAAALVALAIFTTICGYAIINWLPESVLQLVIGTLLLIFGLQWLRKAVYRASGRKGLHDEEKIYEEKVAEAEEAGRSAKGEFDMFAFMVSFKSVFLEGVEVVFIVLTFGLSAHNIPLAVIGAVAAAITIMIIAFIARRPLAMIPENTMKYGVGLLLTSFGMFWSIEGLGIFRAGRESLEFPGADWCILLWIVLTFLLTRVLIAALRPRRARSTATALTTEA